MARKQNDLATVSTTIATTEVQRAYLSELVKTGLYGKNPADAAERLISAELHRLIKEGTFFKKPKISSNSKKKSRYLS